MKKFLGVKLVEAEPMNLGDYNIFRGWELPANEKFSQEGYKIEYPDGYISWCPMEIFEKSHMPLAAPEGDKITEEDVTNFISSIEPWKFGEKTTVASVLLKNGYHIVESSSCVDPKNYNQELGNKICINKSKERIWELLGFLLQCAKGGMR